MNIQLDRIADALTDLAHATTAAASPAEDATGTGVASLTEAVMGMTAGLCKIADAINRLAKEQGSLARYYTRGR
jgi:hypothetical protein